jgi:hypothetical protein
MLRGTLIGDSEEKKKKPPAARKLRIITPFTINRGQCDRGTKPCGREVRKTRRSGINRNNGSAFCIANNGSQEEKAKWL